jgi:hypothetical protein
MVVIPGLINAHQHSIMGQQDFWADTFKMVERKVPQDRVVDMTIAKDAVQRLAAEKPFG